MKKTDIPKFTAPEKPTIKSMTVAKAVQKAGCATASDLVRLTGRPLKSVRDSLKSLHDRSKIHISRYEINKRGQVSRVWVWGDGDDAREPVMLSNKQQFIPRPDVAAAWLRNPI